MMTTSGGVPILEERDISIEITWCTNISMCKGTIYCGSPYRFVAAFVLRGSCPSLIKFAALFSARFYPIMGELAACEIKKYRPKRSRELGRLFGGFHS